MKSTKAEKKDIPLFFDQYHGTPRSRKKRQRFSLPRNTPLVLHPFPKNQKEGVINLPFLKSKRVENKDIPLFFVQYPGTPRSCKKRQRFSLPRNTPLVLHPFPKNQKEEVINLPFLKSKKLENKDIPLSFVQYPGTPRSCRRPQRLSPPRNTPLVLHPFPKNQKEEDINLPFLKSKKLENKDIPLSFVQYPGTPRSCRKRQGFSLPRNTPLVLHPFPKNQKEDVINLPFLKSKKLENKDIPLSFVQYPGTPRSCRKRQRFSLPRNTLLVLHPFPKNQKEGVNLATFSEE